MADPAPVRVDVITIFPGLFEPFVGEAMVGIARDKGRVRIAVHDLRDWTRDRHRTVLLESGRMLIVGGQDGSGSMSSVELDATANGEWIPAVSTCRSSIDRGPTSWST